MSVKAEEGAVRFDAPPPTIKAQSAQRGKIVPTSPAQRQSATRPHVTRSYAGKAAGLAGGLRSGAHITGQLPSIKGQHSRVHEAASEWGHWLPRYTGLAWGYFHLVAIHAPLSLVIWATATRTRFTITAILAVLAWKFR